MEKLTIGLSPCPNDTFIFDALINHKIDWKGYEFDYVLEDVETLNQWALQSKLAITKMSFAASCYLLNEYALLQSGAALGKGVGPLLITKNALLTIEELQNNDSIYIGLPGDKTTAHFLLNYFNKVKGKKIFMPFHQIENWVLDSIYPEQRLGVIIHENRFTYEAKGLHKLQDLGQYWEQQTDLPIPLGGIFIKKSFSQKVQEDIQNIIFDSLQYAFAHYTDSLPPFVTENAQEMSEAVMWQHINLYVNSYSLNIGEEGKKAYELMKKLV